MANAAPTHLYWLRQDFRLHDNPALINAAANGARVLAVMVRDDEAAGEFRAGGAQNWWLHYQIEDFAQNFAKLSGKLIFRRGNAPMVLAALAEQTDAAQVHANVSYEPWLRAADKHLATLLHAQGRRLVRHRAHVLFDPEAIRSQSGGVYANYTAFARACMAAPSPASPLPAPVKIESPADVPASEDLAVFCPLPQKPDWAAGLRTRWKVGEARAHRQLAQFCEHAIANYETARNFPAQPGTSYLSPHLHFGAISPRAIWQAIADLPGEGARCFRSEILWREFSQYLLWHHPTLPTAPLRGAFTQMAWREDAQQFAAWCKGATNVPIVDAGMRELWQTGYMHNRVRMIVASFLIKHLLISWQKGAAWFWDTLVDADLAANSASWQWVAGCGVDAQPFFRVFNPVLQGQKFDPDGTYVKKYVPELRDVPAAFVHAPWTMKGSRFAPPIVDLAEGRARALANWHATLGRAA